MEREKFDVESMDAVVWAKEFMRIYQKEILRGNHLWIDEALMIGWFANAIMAGHDNATRKLQPQPIEDERVRINYNKLREIIRYQVEAYGGKINPKDDFAGFLLDIRSALSNNLAVGIDPEEVIAEVDKLTVWNRENVRQAIRKVLASRLPKKMSEEGKI